MHNANERWYNFNSKYRGKDIKLRSTKTSAKIDFDRLFQSTQGPAQFRTVPAPFFAREVAPKYATSPPLQPWV